jgi:hypothetical protein
MVYKWGIVLLLDVVHSHISSNADDGLAGGRLCGRFPACCMCRGVHISFAQVAADRRHRTPPPHIVFATGEGEGGVPR